MTGVRNTDHEMRWRIARFLRRARVHAGLKQKSIAIVLWQDRTFWPLVSRIEHGHHTVSLDTVDRWLAACRLPLVALGPTLDGASVGAFRR